MLRHPTLAALEALKLTGMATALMEQLEMPEVQRLSFEERLGLLVDRECTVRDNHRLARRLAQARFPGSATLGRSRLSPSAGAGEIRDRVAGHRPVDSQS
jgi:hypothetical protein